MGLDSYRTTMKSKQPKAERLSYFKLRFPDDAILEQLTCDFLADVQAHRAKAVSSE